MERKMLLRLKQRAEQAATTVRRRPFSISHPKAGRTCKGSQNDLVNAQRRLGRLAIGPVPVGGMSLGLDAVPVHRSCRETLDATV